jgi:isopenicillin-N N-acyltransferase like protein
VTVSVVRASGRPRERGRLIGAALAEPVACSLAFYRGFLERRGVGADQLPDLLGPYRDAAERALPDLVEEIEGIAEGAEAPPWELMAANCWEELERLLEMEELVPTPDRCTAFAATGPEGTILGHNEQWYAGDAGNIAVIVERPDGEVPFASPSVVTCLPAVGINAAGVAQGVMSLSAEDDGEGIPRVPVSRLALAAGDADDAVRRAAIPDRSGGYAYVLAAAGGEIRVVETAAADHAIVPGTRGHTNHYLDPRFAARGEGSEGSRARLARLEELLAERDPETPEAAMEILRDHESEPQAICLHPDPAEGDEATAVLFSMVCHLESRRMWVAAGNPCRAPFEEIDLPELREAA